MRSEDQGISINRHSFVLRVLIFVFNSENQVLLLKGAKKKKIWPGKWNGLGGHVEAGEDLLTTVKREMLEESGIISPEIALRGIVTINTGSSPSVCMFVYKVDYGGGHMKRSIEGKLKWVSLDELDNYSLVDDVSLLILKTIEHTNGDELFYGLYEFDETNQLVVKFI